ncbi:zinc finger, CCHC-type, retrotransposon gag domain protein [Tanacetum coccineum]
MTLPRRGLGFREPNFKKVAIEPLVEDGVVGAKPDSSSRGSDAESFFDDPLVCRDIVDKWAPSATMQRFSLMSNDEFVAEYEKGLAHQIAVGSQSHQIAVKTKEECRQYLKLVREEFRDGIGPFNDSGENPPPVTIHTWLERFNKQNPHSFDNAAAPKDAENRISHLEEILMFSRQGWLRRDSGECRRAARNCFKCGQTGHLQQDGKKDTATSTSGHADNETRYSRPCLCNYAESGH